MTELQAAEEATKHDLALIEKQSNRIIALKREVNTWKCAAISAAVLFLIFGGAL